MSEDKSKTDRCRTHLTMVIGEVSDGEYTRCDKCGEKTTLVTAPAYWGVDQADERAEAPEEVEVHDEISAHYCLNCGRITSLSFNECS